LLADDALVELRGGMPEEIPFNKPFITGKEIEYISRIIEDRKLSADGFYTASCARLLQDRFDIRKVLMTPSCTGALEMAAILSGVGPGDEVILPSFTFSSTANAFVRLGARPVFVDIRPDTLNIDESLIEEAVTPATRAIVPVHYAGVSCEMDAIAELARKHSLMVIEDAAQGVNAFYNRRALGTISDLGAYSFHDSKNYVAGECGALCINNAEFLERAEIIREKGTNRSKFVRGEVDKYTWVEIGSSYLPSEIVCAFLYAQLEMMEAISERRREIHDFYHASLFPLANEHLLRLPVVPEGCSTNYHLFFIVLPDRDTRNRLLSHLKENGIRATFHYVPLHSSPMGRKFGYKESDLPLTEDLSGRLLRLPFFNDITESEQSRVVDQTAAFLRRR
jgi:dTDP-4-amino-4,6-dideoxygalactose transaminase